MLEVRLELTAPVASKPCSASWASQAFYIIFRVYIKFIIFKLAIIRLPSEIAKSSQCII